MHVFTYGTLMFPQVWRLVVGRDFITVAGTVDGYSVQQVHDAVYPGMIRGDGCITKGLVYLDVDDAALVDLDRFEDDFYARRLVPVACADGQTREAFAYIVPDAQRHVLSGQPWTAEEFLACGDLERFMDRYGGFHRVQPDRS